MFLQKDRIILFVSVAVAVVSCFLTNPTMSAFADEEVEETSTTEELKEELENLTRPRIIIGDNNSPASVVPKGAVDVAVLEVAIDIPADTNFNLNQITVHMKGLIAGGIQSGIQNVKVHLQGPALDMTTLPRAVALDGRCPVGFDEPIRLVGGEKYYFTILVSIGRCAQPGSSFSFWFVRPDDFAITDLSGNYVELVGDFPVSGNVMTIAGVKSGVLDVSIGDSIENEVHLTGTADNPIGRFSFIASIVEGSEIRAFTVEVHGNVNLAWKIKAIDQDTDEMFNIFDTSDVPDGAETITIRFETNRIVEKGSRKNIELRVDYMDVDYEVNGAIDCTITEVEAVGLVTGAVLPVNNLPVAGQQVFFHSPDEQPVEPVVLEGFLAEPTISIADFGLISSDPGVEEVLGYLVIPDNVSVFDENGNIVESGKSYLRAGFEVRVEATVDEWAGGKIFNYIVDRVTILSKPGKPVQPAEVLIYANNLDLVIGEAGTMKIGIAISHRPGLSEPIISGTLKARLVPVNVGEVGIVITNFQLSELLDGWIYEIKFDEEYIELRFASATPLELPTGGGIIGEVEFSTAKTGVATFVLEEVALNEGRIKVEIEGGEVRVVEQPGVEIVSIWADKDPSFRDIDFWVGNRLKVQWTTWGYSEQAEVDVQLIDQDNSQDALIASHSVSPGLDMGCSWVILDSYSGNYRIRISVTEDGKAVSTAESGQIFIWRYGDVHVNGEISAYDASWILQVLIQGGDNAFDDVPAQAKAADVSGNGVVAPYDAALILQYCVGLIDRFPVEQEVMGAPALLRAEEEIDAIAQIFVELQKVNLNAEQEFVLNQLKKLVQVEIPEKSALLQNFPNPFNPETWIPYQLAESADVVVQIFNQRQLIRTLNLGRQQAGVYQTKDTAAYWDGRNSRGERVASGIYFYNITAGEFSATVKKMLILK